VPSEFMSVGWNRLSNGKGSVFLSEFCYDVMTSFFLLRQLGAFVSFC